MRVEPATLRASAIFPQMDKGSRGFYYERKKSAGRIFGRLDGFDGLGRGAHLRLRRGVGIGPRHTALIDTPPSSRLQARRR